MLDERQTGRIEKAIGKDLPVAFVRLLGTFLMVREDDWRVRRCPGRRALPPGDAKSARRGFYANGEIVVLGMLSGIKASA